MSDSPVKASLIKLRESIDKSEDIDHETLQLAQALEADIQQVLSVNATPTHVDSSLDLAIALESRFESKHPTVAGIARDIIDSLQKMGI